MKVCTGCNLAKPEKEFYRHKNYKDGIRSECKRCTNSKACKWATNNRGHRRITANKWREANHDHTVAYHSAWRDKNRKKCRRYSAASKAKHKDAIKLRRAQWWQANKGRLKANLQWYLTRSFRTRLRASAVERRRYKSIELLLGCSVEDFRIYLETKFEPGMRWENHGEWEIDHIMPCAIFDLTKPEHQKRCFHFSNLQPLWRHENRSKSCKVLTNQFNLI